VAVLIQSKSAADVASVLLKVICDYGCFETLITDQGLKFVNELNGTLSSKLSIDHRIASACHPQTKGQQERFNQTMERAIVKIVNEQHDDWDLHLNRILFAYRTAKQNSTKTSPFYIMYGKEPLLSEPLDVDKCLDAEDEAKGGESELTEDIIEDLRTQVIGKKTKKFSQDCAK